MLRIEFICQPRGAREYRELMNVAFGAARFGRLDAGVAYATVGGVEAILDELEPHLPELRLRWLVALDWCRSEPAALDQLNALPRSAVRVHDGAYVVEQPGCVPRRPFHPKAFVLRGNGSIGVLNGSGNASRNGMTRGHEVGNVIVVANARTAAERETKAACESVGSWFDALWRDATPYTTVRALYAATFEDYARRPTPPVTDDDDASVDFTRQGMLTPEQLRQLRACRTLWIEAGNLHKNRGPGRPGNQLMMKRMSRVYFGFPATDMPTDTAIGEVRIEYAGLQRPDCSLRFSNNSMDVLGLPVPGTGGPAAYDQETLRFDRRGARDLVFVLTLGNANDVRMWKRQSRTAGTLFTMSSGREWGVF